MRRLRVPDGRRRARVAHAPKAANDEARVFAEGGHPPRPAQHLCRMIPRAVSGSRHRMDCQCLSQLPVAGDYVYVHFAYRNDDGEIVRRACCLLYTSPSPRD